MADYIPEKFYVGRSSGGGDTILGFMSPITGDSNCKKRQKSVDRWSDDNLPKLTIDNKAEKGYRVVDNVSRYSTSNVVWRVMHPRGFQIEISSGNFMHLIQECDISEGEFNAELVWVRSGKDNYLTYEGSGIHTKSITLSEVTTKIPLKDVQLGDTVKLKDGPVGVYLGGAHFMSSSHRHTIENKSVRRLVMQTDIKSHSKDYYRAASSLHVVSIVQKIKTPLTKDEAFTKIYDAWQDKNKCDFSMYYEMSVFQKPILKANAEYNLKSVTKDEFDKFSNTIILSWQKIYEFNNNLYVEYTGYNRANTPPGMIKCNRVTLNANKTSMTIEKETVKSQYGHNSSSRYVEVDVDEKLITNYYLLEIVRK